MQNSRKDFAATGGILLINRLTSPATCIAQCIECYFLLFYLLIHMLCISAGWVVHDYAQRVQYASSNFRHLMHAKVDGMRRGYLTEHSVDMVVHVLVAYTVMPHNNVHCAQADC